MRILGVRIRRENFKRGYFMRENFRREIRHDKVRYKAPFYTTDEQPNRVIVHIGSSDSNKFNYSKVDVEDIAQKIIYIRKKYKSYGVNNSLISSILVRKNNEVNDAIKMANNLLRTLSFEQGFTFICNRVIARAML